MSIGKIGERELAPLRKINDIYEKVVIAGECFNPVTQEGIKIILLIDFLLEENGWQIPTHNVI